MRVLVLSILKSFLFKFALFSFIGLAFISFAVRHIHAQGYGEGSYGEGKYNIGEVDDTSGSSNDDDDDNDDDGDNDNDNECTDDVGIQPPWLYGAIPQSNSSIKIQFTEAADPVEKYDLEYGTKSGEYSYHKEDIDVESKSKIDYLIKDLTAGTAYYIRVRGVNGCKNGDWSNEISVRTKAAIAFKDLQIEDSKLEVVSAPPSTVTTPTEETTPDKDQESQEESAEISEEGYTVKIKVLDEEDKPVVGAKVTIHSEVQEAISDTDGNVVFNNVEKGDHRVIIAYNGYEGEQSLNLTGDVKEFSLEIKVKREDVISSPTYLWSVGILGILAIVLITILLKRRK